MIPLDHPSYRIADSRLNLVDLLAAEWVQQDRAMSLRTRAGQASPRAVLHRLGHTVPIAIAAFAALYFGGQLLRVFL